MKTEKWLIAPHRITSEGEGLMDFLLVKRFPGADWERMPDEIRGYQHEEGVEAEIEVEVSRLPDPPADGSSLQFTCTRVVRRGSS
ncbi:DUF4377 domain-containing protein [Marinobacter salinisoli]|uniref:DUF4377 domain-containing protein n=1 Tax=Marinobacter salinisoli TaxID=2769486 RepID=A0ABX7MPT2_9GAMM|nr:DUF4377 domain-containing protein [Marinobacter salinisoli]QSP94326.1 DUF4377 domain-containing protein [Marinobacter salinisoli]